MEISNFLKMSVITLLRDAAFYGYHMARVQSGKHELKESAIAFCDTFPEYNADFDTVTRAYYRYLEIKKSNK